MELKLEVYTPALELVGVLEIQRSVIWAEKAFSAGSFSLESIIAEESRALLVPENILWIAGDTAGIIEHVERQAGAEGPYITVKGRDLTGLLDRRILWGQYSLHGTPAAIMHRLVADCAIHPTRGDVEARKLPGLVSLAVPVGGEAIRAQKTGGTLLEALEQLGETYQVAFGVRFNPAVPCMEFWTRPGADRSVNQSANEPVFYSTELDDVMAAEYSYDSAQYRNAALVAGEGEGGQRVMVTVEKPVEPEPQPPIPPEPGKTYTITLAVDPDGGGVASGGGTVSEGASVTVTATPAEGYVFSGWREGTEIVSTQAIYTFQATADRSLTAVFAVMIPTYTIAVSIDPAQADWGSVSGGGQYQAGATVTLVASPADGYTFSGWQEGGVTVSTDETYSFTATGNRTITAMFAEAAKQLVYRGTATELSVARYGIAATTIGNYALFGGGYASNYSSVVDAYNASLTRTTATALSAVRTGLAATTIGNYALFAGGIGSSYSSVVDSYNTSLTRTTATALSSARNALAATTIGNYALFGGGSGANSSVSSTVNAYDTSLTRSTPTALSTARSSLAATTVGNYALFGGGNASSNYYSVVNAYDTSLTRTTPTSLSTTKAYLGATKVGNFALFGGGKNSNHSSTVNAYDMSLTRSIPTALSKARSSIKATTIGNYALFAGGYTGSFSNVVDAYDDTLTRTTPSPLNTARGVPAATTIGNYALFGGGQLTSGKSNVVDVYTLE